MFIRIDKSYGNLLTAIDWCLRRQVKPEAFLTEYDCPLISDCLAFETEESISARIRNKLKEIIPASVAGRIMSTAWLAWLSEESAMATYIFEYFFKPLSQEMIRLTA